MKRKIIERILSILLAGVLLIGGLSACTNGNSNPSETTGDQESEETQAPTEEVAPPFSEVHIIRNAVASPEFTELCLRLKSFFTDELGIQAKLVSDYSYTDEPVEGRKYIFLGNPVGVEMSQRAEAMAKKGSVVFLAEGDRIAIYSDDDVILWMGIHRFLSDCYKKNTFSIPARYEELVWDSTEYVVDGWGLTFPAYKAGKLDEPVFNCGEGLSMNEAKTSYMQISRNTTQEEYYDYVANLEDFGYEPVFNNYIDGNLYNMFVDRLGGYIYTYYLAENGADKGVVRLIQDRSSNVTPEQFSYTTEQSGESEFFMFNHNNSGEDTFLIRTADNSWIVIDGGVSLRGEDINGLFGTSMYQFMREKSGLADGEKLVIACWYMSHPHRDHFLAFHALIRNHHKDIDLQRVFFNEPDPTVADHDKSQVAEFAACRSSINTFYPNVMYIKAHTGMKIQLADVTFDVLFTQDDITDFWTLNRQTYYDVWCTCFDLPASDPNKAIYRNYHTMYNYNNSSMLSIVTVGDLSVLELGDGFRADAWLVPYYSIDLLASVDILKIAHHYIDSNCNQFYTDFAKKQKTFYALVTNVGKTFSGGALEWKNSLTEKQQVVIASYETIYGFKKVGGKIVMSEYAALYSAPGGINNLR